jgi:hypothetical protein
MNESASFSSATISLQLNRSRVMPWLWAVTGTLVALNVAVAALRDFTGHQTIFGLVPLFDVNSERSIPTFFSACILLGASSLLLLITKAKCARHDRFGFHWAVLAVGFFLLAMDEVAGFHERMTRPVNIVFGTVHGLWYHTWMVAGAAVVLLVVLFYLKFLFHLPVRYQRSFFLAGIIYIGGAIGVEMLGGRYFEIHGNDFIHTIYTALEEGMEMSGIVLFIGALLPYFATMRSEVRITVLDSAASPVLERVPAGVAVTSLPSKESLPPFSAGSPVVE